MAFHINTKDSEMYITDDNIKAGIGSVNQPLANTDKNLSQKMK